MKFKCMLHLVRTILQKECNLLNPSFFTCQISYKKGVSFYCSRFQGLPIQHISINKSSSQFRFKFFSVILRCPIDVTYMHYAIYVIKYEQFGKTNVMKQYLPTIQNLHLGFSAHEDLMNLFYMLYIL